MIPALVELGLLHAMQSVPCGGALQCDAAGNAIGEGQSASSFCENGRPLTRSHLTVCSAKRSASLDRATDRRIDFARPPLHALRTRAQRWCSLRRSSGGLARIWHRSIPAQQTGADLRWKRCTSSVGLKEQRGRQLGLRQLNGMAKTV